MRFGKKLALRVMDDETGAPYVSHKAMKEAINRTVRELRLYQAHLQNAEAWPDGGRILTDLADEDDGEKLVEIERRVMDCDSGLFAIVDEDIARIRGHLRDQEARLVAELAQVQGRFLEAGLLMEESQLSLLERALPTDVTDRVELCRRVLELRIRGDPAAALRAQRALAADCNALTVLANEHTQYMEINVAGFRKLLKRHEKQIPHRFRTRTSPCLDFHQLVTRRSRFLLGLISRTRAILLDARQTFEQAAEVEVGCMAALYELGTDWPELEELKGFGPECEMVHNIQMRLKGPVGGRGTDVNWYDKFAEELTEKARLAQETWLWPE
eukprot:CAMPEP_0176250002 /NCGR_PEP_ID=MMETSP0121_2-20121125/34261_1 /TAXON_ID=160619 /ORGANISM="Kryptoperidinium foliaceum, Strain CCMP 1326" /LENGTH=327 /DNA_ID=CAMNT_0017589705 /DNA_START=93 /DNA_END=1076 /DNA_ORIENTATION=-